MKNIKRLILITVSFAIIFSATYIILKRPDIKFGVEDLLNKREEVALENINLSNLESEIIDINKIKSGQVKNIEYNNNLWVVNKEHHIDEDLDLNLVKFRDSEFLINKSVTNPLEDLIKGAKENNDEGIYLMSTYREEEEQVRLYNEDSAIATAPGASEHQVGLGLDIYASNYAQRNFVKTEVGRWVNNNCWQYGFIIRYPFLKEKITGFKFEPWHIRYVGLPHSEIIYKNRLTLEEYVDSLKMGESYLFNEYLIYHGELNDNKIRLPKNIISGTLSLDNKGGYIITAKLKK